MKVTKIPKNKEKNIYEKKLKVAAYVRVSTLQEAQQTSFHSQYEYYKDRINKISEWEFAGIYADEGISGRKDINRHSFINMINDALDGKINLILTKSISRFARNTVDSLKYIRLLKYNGIGIIFEEENINTLNIGGELLISIFSSIAQIESENTSARVKHGLTMLADNNNYNDYNIPFGYNYVPKSKKITINKIKSKIVKLIFDMCLNGYTIKQILKYLKDNNIYQKRNWSTNAIYKILTNEKYYGKVITVIDNKQYIWDDLYPKIIDKKTFDLVQQELKSRKVEFEPNEKRFLKGKLKCGECYSSLFYRSVKKRWYCGNQCLVTSYNEQLIYDCFNELINELLKINCSYNDNSKYRKLKYKKELYGNKLDNLVDDLIDKRINNNYFENKQNEIIENMLQIENEINNILSIKKKQNMYNNYIRDIKDKIINNYNEKEKLFDLIITKVYLTLDKQYRYLNVDFIYDDGFNDVRNEKGYYLSNTYITLLKKFMKYDFRIKRNSKNIIQILKVKITYKIKEEELSGSISYQKESR